MLRFLVVFSSSEGQTEKVAHHVARQLENRGHVARLINAQDTSDPTAIGQFDAAVIAGSLHMGSHGPALAAFVSERAKALNGVPSAFLSVSLSAASEDHDDIQGAVDAVRTFERETGWTPSRTQLVAGAVHQRQYGLLKRLLMGTVLRGKAAELDPSGETEFTNWRALDGFVALFAAETVNTYRSRRRA